MSGLARRRGRALVYSVSDPVESSPSGRLWTPHIGNRLSCFPEPKNDVR